MTSKKTQLGERALRRDTAIEKNKELFIELESLINRLYRKLESWSQCQRYLSMFHTKIMQATCNYHNQIRKIILRVSQNIFHDPRSLDPRNGMFNLDSDLRHLAIALFLFGGQFLLARLFFG